MVNPQDIISTNSVAGPGELLPGQAEPRKEPRSLHGSPWVPAPGMIFSGASSRPTLDKCLWHFDDFASVELQIQAADLFFNKRARLVSNSAESIGPA